MKITVLVFLGYCILLISVVQIVQNIYATLEVKNLVDFTVYYSAEQKFLEGKNPYLFSYGIDTPGIPFNYPPSSLVVLYPILLLPQKIAEILLSFLSFISLIVTFQLLVKYLHIKVTKFHFLLICSLFIQTFPFKFTLILGQINIVVLVFSYVSLFLFLSSYRAKNDDNRGKITILVAAILFSIASSIKLFPLYVLPLFLLLGNYLFVLLVILFFILLNSIPSLPLARLYFLHILPSLTRIHAPTFYDQSLFAFIVRLTQNTSIATIIGTSILFVLYVSFLVLFYKYRRIATNKNSHGYENMFVVIFSAIFALFSIGNSFSWQHHLIFSFPLIFLLYFSLTENKKLATQIAYSACFLLVWIILVYHYQNEYSVLLKNPFTASYQTITILILVIVQLVRIYKAYKNIH